MKEKTWFDRWVDFEYERLNNLITTEIRQKLEIIEELGLENEIDKYLIKGGLVGQESCKFTTTTRMLLKII